MSIALESHLLEVSSPANLRINDQIRAFREACRRGGCNRPYHHFAFGQSPFPPPPTVVEALAKCAGHHDYYSTEPLRAWTGNRRFSSSTNRTIQPECFTARTS